MNDRRNAVFLEEMGVGPQWCLRHRTGAVAPDIEATEAAVLAPVAATAPHAATAAAPHAAAASVPMPASTAMPASTSHAPLAASAAAAMPASAPQAAHTPQPPDAPAELGGMPAAPGPRATPAPAAAAAAAPATPARAPGAPSIASTGEDMSWFDDAPTPEYKPQRKKTAAEPERTPAVQPQRAAPAAPPARPARAASAPPPAMADGAPDYDDMGMDQPPAWFDDDLPAAAPAARGTDPAPGRATDEEIAAMDWPALQAAIGACARCARCATRRQAVPGRGDEQATWLALDTAPGQAEDSEGYQFAGDPGYLLDNMLKAVGQTTEQGAYLTSLVKCHAPHAPDAEELQACRPYLERELALTQAKVIVTFGHSAGKGLLGAAARGRIMLHGSVPVVATYHPADLLKKPEEKAKAWQDLCLAKAAHAGRR